MVWCKIARPANTSPAPQLWRRSNTPDETALHAHHPRPTTTHPGTTNSKVRASDRSSIPDRPEINISRDPGAEALFARAARRTNNKDRRPESPDEEMADAAPTPARRWRTVLP